MKPKQWLAHVTVAAVIEQGGRFLFVEEKVGANLVLNQPAGHLEDRESLLAAVQRETLEETAWHFIPTAIIGIYLYRSPSNGATYHRICFSGEVGNHDPQRVLDVGIVRTLWLSYDEILQNQARLRNVVVKSCLDDYLAGKRYPLELINYFP